MTIVDVPLPQQTGRRARALLDSQPLSFGDFHRLLTSDPTARMVLTTYLAGLPYQAIHWETPPASRATLASPFEFVVIDSPPLASAQADSTPFAKQLHGSEPIVDFVNLGGDAHLVVPSPSSVRHNFAHLLSFLRSAPLSSIDALWQRVGDVFLSHVGVAPLWVSTAGLGVSWLHVRFDQRPKYYQYAPYRSPAWHGDGESASLL